MTRRTTLTIAACLLLALGTAATATAGPDKSADKPAAPSANEIVDRVQQFYDKTKTFSSPFTQRFIIKARNNKTIHSGGQLIVQKPGKMSWRYTTNGNRVVSDGRTIKMYEKENKQMYEQPMKARDRYTAALAFLGGSGKLKEMFDLAKLDPAKANFPGGHVLLGKPKESTPAYEQVLFYIDAKTYHVRRVRLIDAQNNSNIFEFTAPIINRKVPPHEFKFTPPKGTQIIRP